MSKYSNYEYMDTELENFHNQIHELYVVKNPSTVDAFIKQLSDSINRVKYFERISSREISSNRANPSSSLFDPLKAILYLKEIDFDEACWLAFLTIHFGESKNSNWKLTKTFYSGHNLGKLFAYSSIKNDIGLVQSWVDSVSNDKTLKLKFGNHRKYESLKNLPYVISSYYSWVDSNGGHENLFKNNAITDSKELFKELYEKITIIRFGRLAKFDYLSLLYKTKIANILADCCYIKGSTGPSSGAKKMFGANYSDSELDSIAMKLADHLNIGYQEMEDALCNWQKSPEVYKPFRG